MPQYTTKSQGSQCYQGDNRRAHAYFLSSDFATVLSGRYIELAVFPLSFAEYVSAFKDKSRLDLLLNDYLVYGGFPAVANLLIAGQKAVVNDYLLGIYNTVITKDIVERYSITELSKLDAITKFILSNAGSLVSPQKTGGHKRPPTKDFAHHRPARV